MVSGQMVHAEPVSASVFSAEDRGASSPPGRRYAILVLDVFVCNDVLHVMQDPVLNTFSRNIISDQIVLHRRSARHCKSFASMINLLLY